MSVSRATVLDQIVLVSLDCRIWSGRRMLRKEDLMVKGALPPSDLVSLGSKKIIDPSELSGFNAVKKRMERACMDHGTRFLGGYAIPLESFDEITKILDSEVDNGIQKKAELLSHYDGLIDSWVARHPTYEAIIRRAVIAPAVVADRLHFSWHAYRINPVANSEAAEARINQQAAGLGQRLLDEVAQEASVLHKRSFFGKVECTQKAIGPIDRLRKKMGSLSFVDTRIRPLCQEIDKVLGELPKTGKLQGIEFHALRGLIELLSSEEKIREYVDAPDDVEISDEELDDINEPDLFVNEAATDDEEVIPPTPAVPPIQKPIKRLGQSVKGWTF